MLLLSCYHHHCIQPQSLALHGKGAPVIDLVPAALLRLVHQILEPLQAKSEGSNN